MSRPFIFPDPNNTSPNQPLCLSSQTQVLGLYNQEHPNDKAKNVTEKVRTWFTSEAKAKGWESSKFVGNQCILDSGMASKKTKKNNF